MNNKKSSFINGLLTENPVFGLYLGICSTLAITTSLNNAIGMGVAVIFVLTFSNIIISAMRNIIPNEIRIPVYIVIIATLVTIVEMLIHAYAPSLYSALGAFISLIVVNCIILGRAEAFASKNGILASAMDGISMGIGYTLSLLVMSLIRQILGTGVLSFANPFTDATIFSFTIIPESYVISMFKDPTGAFLTFACCAAALTAYINHKKKKEASK